jgi:hypothetical protein
VVKVNVSAWKSNVSVMVNGSGGAAYAAGAVKASSVRLLVDRQQLPRSRWQGRFI